MIYGLSYTTRIVIITLDYSDVVFLGVVVLNPWSVQQEPTLVTTAGETKNLGFKKNFQICRQYSTVRGLGAYQHVERQQQRNRNL